VYSDAAGDVMNNHVPPENRPRRPVPNQPNRATGVRQELSYECISMLLAMSLFMLVPERISQPANSTSDSDMLAMPLIFMLVPASTKL
jgi:hypothetical protein